MTDRRTVLASAAAGIAVAAAATSAEAANIDVVKAIILAWRKLDVDGVMKHVDESIVWYPHVGGKPPLAGKEAMRAFISKMREGIAENTWRVFKYAASGDDVFCEGVDDFKLKDGKQVTVPYLGLMTVKKGLVTEWRDYFDGGMTDRIKRGELDYATDPIALSPLITRKALF